MKYFKVVYNLRPLTQKIIFVWNVKILFDFYNHKGKNGQLSDKSLTQKLLILLLLLGGQRMNTVYFFTVDRMTVTDIGLHFHLMMFLNIQNQEKNWTVSTIGHITTERYVL